jgi:hypothetical protein
MAGRVMGGADDDRNGGSARRWKLQLFDRVGDLVQVLLREVQIPGCHLQILMTEQKLDGAQVGSGFKQMRRPAVANQVRSDSLADAGPLSSFGASTPHDLVCNRLFAVTMHA